MMYLSVFSSYVFLDPIRHSFKMWTQPVRKLLYWRIWLSKFVSFGTILDLNKETKRCQIVPGNGFLYWNSLMNTFCGSIYAVILSIYLLLKMFFDEIGVGSGSALASHIIGWAELITIITIVTSSFHILPLKGDMAYLCNQLVFYSKNINGKFITQFIN